MLIVMKSDATGSDVDRVIEVIETLGFRGHAMPGENRTAIGITGNPGSIDPAHFENLNGVAQAIRVTQPYKLISKDIRPEKSVVKIGNSSIGGGELAMNDRRDLTRFQQRPDAQRIEDAPAAVGQCRGPIVEARLPERAERMGFDQNHVERELGQRQCERGTHEPAAADRDVAAHTIGIRRDRCHSSASLWRRRLSAHRG